MKLGLKQVLKTIGGMLGQIRYAVVAVGVVVVMLIILAWLPNWRLAMQSIGEGNWRLVWGLTQSLTTNYDSQDLLMLGLSAGLGGVQVALLTYYLNQKAQLGREAGMGVVGIMGSIVGVGCASCGSIFLTSVVGLSATSALFTYLPLNGLEFGIGGLALLVSTVYVMAKKLAEGEVCAVPTKKERGK